MLNRATALALPLLSPQKTPQSRSLLLALGLGLSLALVPALQTRAESAPDSFADLAEQISPSVVNITTSAIVAASTEGGPMVPEGSPFEEFFKDFNQQGPGSDEPQRSDALGSGFVISADGYIVTNNHVIEGADQIEIEFYDKTRLQAKLVGTDLKTDIALLKVESPTALPFVAFGDSDAMRVGDWVDSIHAIGDVTNRLNLTPVATSEGMALAKTLFGGKPTPVDHENVPTAVFANPNLGTVGLSEAKARERFGKVDIYKTAFRSLKHTMGHSEERIFMKLVVDATSQRVVGAHMLGPDAGEIIQGIAIAVKLGATKAQFDATIGIHPTAAEEFVTMREKSG